MSLSNARQAPRRVVPALGLVLSLLPTPAPLVAIMPPPPRSCPMEAVERSLCILEAILTDVRKTYKPRGGGGVSAIVLKSSTRYQVQIAQEGRTDLIDYDIAAGANGAFRILQRTQSSTSR